MSCEAIAEFPYRVANGHVVYTVRGVSSGRPLDQVSPIRRRLSNLEGRCYLIFHIVPLRGLLVFARNEVYDYCADRLVDVRKKGFLN